MGEMLLNGRLYGASGIRELTQAQYDALPASKLTDGILYCIKDTGIVEGEKFAPVIYSLEEREIGVHTNGKPLYEKTYRWAISDLHNSNIQSGNMYGEFWFDHVAYDEFWMYDAKIINKGTNWRVKSLLINTPHESTIVMSRTNIQMYQQVNDGYPFAYFKSADSGPYADRNSLTFYYTIRYTKTTDIPGSGTWGTDGVPMVHYDGNEKIIGTWFGETLYEKTIVRNNIKMGNDNGTKTEIAHGISNFGIPVSLSIKCPYLGVVANDILYDSSGVAICGFRVNNTNVYCVGGTAYFGASTDRYWYINIQYTKTN